MGRKHLADRRYAPACIKLLAQYKSLMKLVGDDIGGVEAFMRRFKVRSTLTRALRRPVCLIGRVS